MTLSTVVRTRRQPGRWLAIWTLAALVSAGCGDEGGSDYGGADAAPGGTCSLAMEVPTNPDTSTEMIVYGLVNRDTGQLYGQEHLFWQVFLASDGDRQMTTSPGELQHSVRVVTSGSPGVYRIELTGDIGGRDCTAAIETVNVRDYRARVVDYRLRAISPAADQVPVQDRDLQVYGGTAAVMARWELSAGRPAQGVVHTDTGEGAPAYLRFTAPNTPQIEAFSGADGRFSTILQSGVSYQLLVIPQDSALAPSLLPPMTAEQLSEIQVDGGHTIDGTVRDSLGLPVVDARVTGHLGQVPTTIATTDENGQFTLRIGVDPQGSLPLAATVVPPASSGLPTVELRPESNLVPTAGLAIEYASTLTARSVALAVKKLDGTTPAVGARVTFRARTMAAAATAESAGASASMAGTTRITAVVDVAGVLPPLLLPEATYDVVVEPASAGPGESVNIAFLDLAPGQPTPPSLNLAPPARLVGQVYDAQALEAPPVTGVDISAHPQALLANTASASAFDTSGDGTFALALAGNGAYQLTARSRDDRFARVAMNITAPAAGQELDIGALAMPATLEIEGSVALPGSTTGAGGIHLMVLCYDCTGVDAERPIAEVVTSPTGAFVLHVPDPGIEDNGS